jgi:HK97 family phage major capsid protein
MFNDSTLKVIKKLKDSNGRPLWLPQTGSSLESKVDPATLLGYNYEINQHVASLAANAKAVLFGAFKKYLIRDVMAMQLFRFTDSVYVKKGQIGFLAWARADGNLIDASNTSVRYLTQPAT